MTARDSMVTQSFSSREKSATEKWDSAFSELLQQIHAGGTTLQNTTKLKEKASTLFSLLEDKQNEGTLTFSKKLGKHLPSYIHVETQTRLC